MFKLIGLSRETLLLFDRSGYDHWTSQTGGGIAQTTQADWDKIRVAPGEQERLRIALQHIHDGTFNENYALPRGSMGIPRQTWAPMQQASTDDDNSIFGLVIAKMKGIDQFIDSLFMNADFAWIFKMIISPLLLLVLIVVIGMAISALMSPPAIVAAATVVGDCVPGDASILVPGRKQVHIRNLKPGDTVISYFKKKARICHVMHITKRSVASASLSSIKLANGSSIVATKNHAFWVNGQKWSAVTPDSQSKIKVHHIQRGDLLVDFLGRTSEVCAVDDVSTAGPVEVFNLLVEGHGSFFVNGFLSHSGMKAASHK
mmetsp:Transcript_36737/g.70657  ORF Transcript_36737/g.70657 Transcript_36737/m.70657 type:complete len:316 (-) Transcript_36737:332-1279(-)